MTTIQETPSSRQNTPPSPNTGEEVTDSQQDAQRRRDTATLQEETIEDLEEEVSGLREAARRAELQAERERLRSAAGAAIIVGSSSVPAGGANAPTSGNAGSGGSSGGNTGGAGQTETTVIPRKAKSLKPEKLRPYKGLSEGEHGRWFREARLCFARSPDYFLTDADKILHAMISLEGDPQIQWHQHTGDGLELEGETFENFETFLLNLVAGPTNRRLNAYERWEEAKQNPNQKVTAFKAYLEDLESHLSEFSETHRAFFFLSKLRPDLKQKILGTGSVPDTREGILGVAIMQEKNLERSRGGGGHSNSNPNSNSNRGQPKPKGSRGSKPQQQSQQPRPSNDQQGSKPRQQPARTSSKRTHDTANSNPDLKDVECWNCKQKGHYSTNCPQPKAIGAVIGEVQESKKESAPQSRPKRSKKDQ